MSAAATGPQRVPDLRPADRAAKPSEDTAASPDLVDGTVNPAGSPVAARGARSWR
jgi:hypothetical protein